MSVKRAMREIDSQEFAGWMAYSVHEPFGPEREDQRAGMIAALIANVNRDPKKRTEPYDVEDFFPRYESTIQAPEVAPVDLEAKIKAWAATMNAANDKKSSELKAKG